MDAPNFKQPKWLFPLAFCPPLVLYLATMSPTLTYGGDCGELIAASYVLGNAHPTGYPLYLLLGKLFSLLLPIGEVAFRYNLFSALCSAGAAAVVASIIFRLCRDACAALTAAWSMACAYTVWTQAIIAEVYALSALLISLLILSAIMFIQTNDARWLKATAFAFGIGLTNHLPILFVGAPLGGYCLWQQWKAKGKRQKAKGVWMLGRLCLLPFAFYLLLPMLLYVYLPLRAQAQPPMNWGNPATFSAFWAHVSGKLYQPHVFAFPLVVMPQRLLALGGLMVLQFLLAFPIGLIGFYHLARKGWGLALLLGVMLDVVIYVNYDVLDLWNFFFPLYVTFGLCIGLGAASLRTWVRKFFVSIPRLTMAFTTACLLCLPLLQAWAAYPRVNMSGNCRADQDARALMNATTPNSTLFIKGDESLFGLWYLQHVEGKGKDRKIVYGKEVVDGKERAQLHRRVRSALNQGRVYLNFWYGTMANEFYLRPRGPVCEVLTQPLPPRRVENPSGKPLRVSSHGTLWSAALSQTTIKRGNMLTLTTRWQPRAEVRTAKMELLFSHVSLGKDAPSENRELASGVAINKQFLAWRAQRSLQGREPAVWEESFPIEILDSSMIGKFHVFARLVVNGRTSPWQRVGKLEIVDK